MCKDSKGMMLLTLLIFSLCSFYWIDNPYIVLTQTLFGLYTSTLSSNSQTVLRCNAVTLYYGSVSTFTKYTKKYSFKILPTQKS